MNLLKRIETLIIPIEFGKVLPNIVVDLSTWYIRLGFMNEDGHIWVRVFIEDFPAGYLRSIEKSTSPVLLSTSGDCRITITPYNSEQNYFFLDLQDTHISIHFKSNTGTREPDEIVLKRILEMFTFSRIEDLKADENGNVISDNTVTLNLEEFTGVQ